MKRKFIFALVACFAVQANSNVFSNGMTITGDGLLSDGSMMIDLQNAVVGDEAASYTLSGTLDLGEIITFSGTIGAGSSYAQFDAQIWNVTDNILLAETPSGSDRVISQAHNVLGVPVDFTLSYTGLASDAGDVIQVRINDNGAWGGSTGRNIYMDNVMITAIPNSALPITGFTNTFSNAEDITAWASVGTSTTVISHSSYQQDFDDGDPTQILAYTSGMTITGDGLLSDGSMMINLQNSIVGDEAAGYMLTGSLAVGEEITFSGAIGAGSTYAQFDAQIWNMTDNILLAETPSGSDRVISQAHNVLGVPVDFSLSYTGLASDAGDVIQVRINDNGTWGGSVARNIYVDNVVVTITPSVSLVMYEAWLDDYPSLGTNTKLTDNPDGDALNNLHEYAFGGDPTHSADVGLPSTYAIFANQIEYIYHMRSDAAVRGLTYEVLVCEDLVAAPVCTNLGVTVTGINVGAVVNGMGSFDIVTNQIPIDGDTKFIRLNIEQQ